MVSAWSRELFVGVGTSDVSAAGEGAFDCPCNCTISWLAEVIPQDGDATRQLVVDCCHIFALAEPRRGSPAGGARRSVARAVHGARAIHVYMY